MKEKIDVVCVGILTADIPCSPIEKVPEPGELISTEKIFLSGGGHAHNTSISLARLGAKVGVMGKEGSLARTKDKVIQASAYKIEVVDPSGGGDAFTAGFIFGVINDWELEKTLKFASAIGASAGRKIGCTTGVFTREEACKFIKNNEIELKKSKRLI